MTGTVVGYDVAAIQKMFNDYVGCWDGKNRHTPEANHKIALYTAFTSGAFQMNSGLQDELYNRMMECAVEFEESGFIAGFRAGFQCALTGFQNALSLSPVPATPANPEPVSPAPSAGTTPPATAQEAQGPDTNPPTNNSGKANDNPAETGKAEAEASWSISSREIAKLFGASHMSVMLRIENRILPMLDAQSKRLFRKDSFCTNRGRSYPMYRLNKAACDIYMKYMSSSKYCINVAGGLSKMEELMKTVFQTEAAAS